MYVATPRAHHALASLAPAAAAPPAEEALVAAAPPPAPPGVHVDAPRNLLKELSQANRARLDLIKLAQADAASGIPQTVAAFQAQTQAHLDWLVKEAARPEHAAYGEFFRSWLATAADLWLAARPLPSREAQHARYAELDQRFQAGHAAVDRALVVAAAKALQASQPKFPPGAPSADVRAALAPAIGHLARSGDPAARELARRIAAGEIPFKVTTGGQFGVQYFAMVQVKGITVSNGDVGPDFFALSPAYQAAVLRHEFVHVGQKGSLLGFLRVMGSNLAQRFCALAARVPGLDADAWETRGRRYNATEQEAYRIEKDFLRAQGWGIQGAFPSDAGMLEGVDTWLEAAAPSVPRPSGSGRP